MDLSRRQFVALSAAVAAACCTVLAEVGHGEGGPAATSSPAGAAAQAEDAGPLNAFTKDDVYDQFREQGFFVVRRDKTVFALSSVCTHKGCKVRVADDLSFFCKCHKSTFDKDGHVTKGPAKRDLPRLQVAEDARGHLLVNLEGVPPPDAA